MKRINQSQETGQSQVEYALLIALVALVAIVSLVILGPKIGDVFSEILNWSSASIEEENPGHIVVRVVDADYKGIENVRVYAFNAAGRYQRKYSNTDSNGEVTFADMEDGGYKFRANYQGKQFWSEVINWQAEWLAVIETGQRPFTVQVVDAAMAGIDNVRVYAFTSEDHYIGVYGNSDSNGELIFDLSDGSYQFRANFRGHQYWSDAATSPQSLSATVETGERPFTVTVSDAAGAGVEGVRVYAFTADGSYIGVYGNTGEGGKVTLDIPDGSFKFRANYRSHQYWSDPVETPGNSSATIETGQQSFTVRVIDAQENGLNNVRVYAFADEGNYIGIYGNSDAQGLVTLDIPDGAFKFRADYRGHQYWSNSVNTPGQDTAVIKTNEQAVSVAVIDSSGSGISNVRVYAFTSNDRYVGTYGNTDAAGIVLLPLPDGTYKFRANYRGNEYWSGTVTTPGNTSVTIETGEVLSTVYTKNDEGQPIANVRVYAYTTKGNYTGVYGNTDAAGQVSLILPVGEYQFRADYQGSRYWSESVTTPGSVTVTLSPN